MHSWKNSLRYFLITSFILEQTKVRTPAPPILLFLLFLSSFLSSSKSNHLVVYNCWNTSQILSWMQKQNLATFGDVFNYYEQQLHAMGSKFSRTPVNWQEVFDDNIQLPSNIVVQVWKEYVDTFSCLLLLFLAVFPIQN